MQIHSFHQKKAVKSYYQFLMIKRKRFLKNLSNLWVVPSDLKDEVGFVMKHLNHVEFENCVGSVCNSKNSGDFKIINYKNASEVTVEFLQTKHKVLTSLDQIKRGSVKDVYYPSICGVGVIGNKYQISYRNEDDKQVFLKEYRMWSNMIRRCYSEKQQIRQPAYKGCIVSENFKSYEYFYEWCHDQVGFGNEGWHLDKDVLIKGNRIYSEDTCVFLPRELNNLLTKSDKMRGDFPIGVYFHKDNGKFRATLNENCGKLRFLGYFDDYTTAFLAYKEAKESFIKEQVYRWSGKIDVRVIDALKNYSIEITD